MLCMVRGLSAVGRLPLGPILPLLGLELSISAADKGPLLASFSTGYLLTQMAGGCVADRVGARLVIFLALVSTAAGLALAPAAAAVGGASVAGLSGVYFMLGVVNGPLFPACSVMLRHVGPQGRASAMAIVDDGATLGGCVATALCPVLATWIGWRQLYHLLAAAAFITAMVWSRMAPDSSPKQKDIKPLDENPSRSPLAIFLHPGPWALFCAHAMFN